MVDIVERLRNGANGLWSENLMHIPTAMQEAADEIAELREIVGESNQLAADNFKRAMVAEAALRTDGVAQAPTEAQIERGARAMCEWKHGVGSWDTFSSLRDHFVGQMRAGLSTLSSTTRVSAAEILGDPLGGVSIPSTHQRCAKCGCETGGEAALVDGKIWCHPCADGCPVTSTDSGSAA